MALVPVNISEAESMAVSLSKSALVPEAFRNKPADTFMAIAYGLEIGIPPVSALRAVAVIKGKPTLYADAMVGLVLASGKAKYFTCVESDGIKATYETHRHGAPVAVRKTFSLDDAKAAGLLSNATYKSYPRQMLEARAKAHLARDQYPDLLHGIYSAEEAAEFQDERPAATVAQFRAPEPETILDAEVIEPGPAMLDLIAATESLAELDSLTPQIRKLPKAAQDALRTVYATRKRELKQAAAQREADELADAFTQADEGAA
jgi:hypothetical protein